MFRKITNVRLAQNNVNTVMGRLNYLRAGTNNGTGWMWTDSLLLVWHVNYVPDFTVDKTDETTNLLNEIRRFKWHTWVSLDNGRIHIREPLPYRNDLH